MTEKFFYVGRNDRVERISFVFLIAFGKIRNSFHPIGPAARAVNLEFHGPKIIIQTITQSSRWKLSSTSLASTFLSCGIMRYAIH